MRVKARSVDTNGWNKNITSQMPNHFSSSQKKSNDKILPAVYIYKGTWCETRKKGGEVMNQNYWGLLKMTDPYRCERDWRFYCDINYILTYFLHAMNVWVKIFIWFSYFIECDDDGVRLINNRMVSNDFWSINTGTVVRSLTIQSFFAVAIASSFKLKF